MSAQDKQIIDVLMDRERVIGATRMFLDGTDAASVTRENEAPVIHNAKLYLERRKLTQKDLARDIGVTPGVISEVFNSNYKGNWQSIILQIDRWLDQQAKSDAAPQSGPFVWTAVAKEIEAVANTVSHLKKIGLIYGPDTPGIGKTMALQAVHQSLPGSILVTIDKVHGTPTGLLREIAGAVKVGNGTNNGRTFDRIVAKLRDTKRLLMIDQIHNLRYSTNDNPFYYLTDLWDRTKSPQLWCGTADLAAYFKRGKKGDESLMQINSRMVYKRDLMARTRSPEDGGRGEPLFTVEDIIKVFASNKMRLSTDAIQMLWAIACLPESGALRTAANAVQIATLAAEQLNMKVIDPKLIKAALRDSDIDGFDDLMSEATDFIQRRKVG